MFLIWYENNLLFFINVKIMGWNFILKWFVCNMKLKIIFKIYLVGFVRVVVKEIGINDFLVELMLML